MQKTLNITVQKKINNFLYNAYFLCITLVHKNLYPWFCERYIQLYYNPNRLSRYGREVWLDFFGGWSDEEDVLTYTECDRSIFNSMNIIDFVESNINTNNYVYTYIDEYYINLSLRECNEHFVHDIFVYAYDKENKQFMVVGFDEKQNFCRYSINYQTFETAFMKGFELTEKDGGWKCYGLLIQCKYNEEIVYEFKLSNFLTRLHEYLYSVNSSKINKSSRNDPIYRNYILEDNVYGMNIYDELLKYLSDENLVRSSALAPNNAALDYRVFHTLYEHKAAISERLNYIINNFDVNPKIIDLANEYKKVEQSYMYARTLAARYVYRKNESIITELTSLISTWKISENKLLVEIYDLLSK